MYSKILLATDGSDHAYRAAKAMMNLASKNVTEITLLFINDSQQSSKKSRGNLRNEQQNPAQNKKKLQATEELLFRQGFTPTVKVIDGDPEVKIVQFLKDHPHDILVMGSRGLNAFQQMVLGSVSHKVMKLAPCPVMIVK